MRSDVAVVGAGPAGTWAAHVLARHGARVALIDPSHPREKPCGGGVTGRALAIVGRALDGIHLSTREIHSARFIDSGTGRSASVGLTTPDSDAPDLIVASRAGFDAALVTAARRAGATLLDSRVLDLVEERGGFRVETRSGTLRVDCVIGADGANSLVRRRVARPFLRDQLSIATGF